MLGDKSSFGQMYVMINQLTELFGAYLWSA